MSSQYPILNNKPIDQWKVVELKEELKRRKIPVKGLKEDLVRKLDEAIRNEMAMDKDEQLRKDPKPGSDYQANGSAVQEDPAERCHPGNPSDKIGKIANENIIVDLDDKTVDDSGGTKDQSMETLSLTGNNATLLDTAVGSLQMEDAATERHSMPPHNVSAIHDLNTNVDLEDWKAPVEDAKDNLSEPEKQVPVVNPDLGSPDKTETITTDYVSINENNNLKNNLNADNFHLELEVVKAEMVRPSSSNVLLLDDDVHPSDDEKIAVKNLALLEQIDTKDSTELDIAKKEDTADVDSPEKLNLELEVVIPEMVQPSSSNAPLLDGDVHPSGDEKIAVKNLALLEQIDTKDSTELDIAKKEDTADAGSPEKLNLEIEVVIPEMVQPSSSNVPLLDGNVHPSDDEKVAVKNLASLEQIDTKAFTELDIAKKEDTADVGSPEKLNLDRSSGDESMDEDVIETKHAEPSIESVQLGEQSAVIENYTADKVTDSVTVVGGADLEMTSAVDDEKGEVTAHPEKRKLEGQSPVRSTEPVKRQRRCISDTLKAPERQASNISTSSAPKDILQTTPEHIFPRTESKPTGDSPKERFVAPSLKPATTSLRIDKFVRPFTLKAVQEMLGKTGTVCKFWMDQIKTHCYVTYSSVEEAVTTRNAVYNLQWPHNGGNLLVAEFVDPQEVKMRAEAPAQLAASISPNQSTPMPPAFQQPQPAQPTAGQQTPRQQLLRPSVPLAQPSPSSDSPLARKELPAPPPTKPESPALTLDDLFKKTKATPRIYYLPLTDEQVAAKLATPGKM